MLQLLTLTCPRAYTLQRERPPHWDARRSPLESCSSNPQPRWNYRKARGATDDPAQPKTKLIIFLKAMRLAEDSITLGIQILVNRYQESRINSFHIGIKIKAVNHYTQNLEIKQNCLKSNWRYQHVPIKPEKAIKRHWWQVRVKKGTLIYFKWHCKLVQIFCRAICDKSYTMLSFLWPSNCTLGNILSENNLKENK